MRPHTPITERPPRRPPPDNPLAAAGTGDRARRARTEPMTLRPLRDGRTIVETDGGTYVVDAAHERCTCPDHAIRNVRCKHLRRVAIEAAAGTIPPAGMREGACALCAEPVIVDIDQSTALCERHAFEPGECVVDRETGSLLVVVEATTDRADEREIDDGQPIAAVETNRNYGDHEPVIEAVYASALGRPGAGGSAKQYGFPAGRLRHTDRDPARGQRLLASHQSAGRGEAAG